MSTFKYLGLRTTGYTALHHFYYVSKHAVRGDKFIPEDIYRKIPKISPGFVCLTSWGEVGGGGERGRGGEGGLYLKGLIFGFYCISSDCYTVRGVLVLPVLKTRYIHTVNVIYLKATLIGALKVCNKFLRTL